MPIYATVAPKLGFSTEYFGILSRLIGSPVFWGMAVVLPALCLMRDFAWKYAKRMYYPQTYHHIQEIQKYNIQDYRPRYRLSQYSTVGSAANNSFPFPEWSNSKRRLERLDRCRECASSADTHSHKPMRAPHGCSKFMIPRRREGDTERCRVQLYYPDGNFSLV